MVTKKYLALLMAELIVCAVAPKARAQTAASPTTEAPAAVTVRVHHAPKSVAPPHVRLELGARVEHVELARRVVLVYRHQGAVLEVPFERSSQGQGSEPYIAVVPEDHVGNDLAYAIEVEDLAGRRAPVFASRESMHPVQLTPDLTDAQEAALLEQNEGRRSTVSAFGEVVSFGTTDAMVREPGSAPGSPLTSRRFSDGYYRVEGAYTYRILRTVAEFGIRAGVVRGRSVVAGETDPNRFDVGLNYGAPRLRLRATPELHFEGEFLTSVTEVGFAVGGGGAVIIGDPYATRLALGVEGIDLFGWRAYSRLDVVTSRRWSFAPIVEVTTMPNADKAGVRLIGELGLNLGKGFAAQLRGGYQARSFSDGGPSAGLAAAYSF